MVDDIGESYVTGFMTLICVGDFAPSKSMGINSIEGIPSLKLGFMGFLRVSLVIYGIPRVSLVIYGIYLGFMG